jgi:hypothetical protein
MIWKSSFHWLAAGRKEFEDDQSQTAKQSKNNNYYAASPWVIGRDRRERSCAPNGSIQFFSRGVTEA